MKKMIVSVCSVLLLSSCSDHHDAGYGPYWSYNSVVPPITASGEQVSTSFTGHVGPVTRFVVGAADRFTWTTPNAKLTINANTVWAYQPIVVGLYDGPRDSVGSLSTQIAEWVVPPPVLGGVIDTIGVIPLGGRIPLWASIDFIDFSGICILQVLGQYTN